MFAVTLKAARVWTGEQQPKKGASLTKVGAGKIGEKIAAKAATKHFGGKFEFLNVNVNNSPIDMWNRKVAIEVKTGIASNNSSNQAWRATIGEPWKAEQESLDKMSPGKKKNYNAGKRKKILERKHNLLAKLSRKNGSSVKGYTMGVILSPGGRRGDVYLFKGFHPSLLWSKYATDKFYLGTYSA